MRRGLEIGRVFRAHAHQVTHRRVVSVVGVQILLIEHLCRTKNIESERATSVTGNRFDDGENFRSRPAYDWPEVVGVSLRSKRL